MRALLIAFAVIALFGLAVVAVVMQTLVIGVNDAFTEQEVAEEAQSITQQAVDMHSSVYDWLALCMYLGLAGAAVTAAYLSPNSKLMGFLSFLVVIAMLAVPMAFSEAWAVFSDSETIRSTVATMPVTDFILSNYALLTVGVGFLAGVARSVPQ